MRVIYLITLLMLALPGVAADKVYKKINPDGTVEFSDQPAEGSEEVQLQQAPSIKIEKPKSLDYLYPERGNSNAQIDYSLKINSPANEETIRDNTGNVTLKGQISPALVSGHRMRWMLDGEVLPERGTTISLSNVERGSHTVQMQVVDSDGQVLGSSDPVTFHLRRHSTIPPANPAPNFPAPKPKPPTP